MDKTRTNLVMIKSTQKKMYILSYIINHFKKENKWETDMSYIVMRSTQLKKTRKNAQKIQ